MPDAKTVGRTAGSRSDHAYQYVRSAIRNGDLAPGTRLRETELAELLGLSRTPVREALGRLESEGLVANEPGRGLIVTELDHGMISELYVMREVLEGTAARLAARHASDVEIATLREIADRDDALRGDAERLAANNRYFHETLYRCAHNRYLLKTLNSLQESMALLGPTTLEVPERAATSTGEHQEVVAALEARDPDLAEKLTREHIRASYKVRLSRLWPTF
ncbi:GntR family transcriptional regulator [Pigmentiphaga soli]|uniref:GntR family transcriptional regulator n=1 Tax=Pigmentiphaga soli TaxID=1007095 RepID=A0ABP8H1B2_9BURK